MACEALKELMRDEIEGAGERAKEVLLISMAKDGEVTIECAAKRLGITPEEFRKKL